MRQNVAMTATETITSNPRVLGADPLVVYQPAEDGQEEMCRAASARRIIVCLVLPYIQQRQRGCYTSGTACWRQYGTYEMNGIAFQDTGRDLVAGDHRRTSLDGKKSAG